jgi:hypothetical protein
MRTVTMRWVRSLAATSLVAIIAVVGVATPAGAQQLVDAGGDNGQGGLAFVLMAVMVFLIGFGLVFMDRVRRRANRDHEEHP